MTTLTKPVVRKCVKPFGKRHLIVALEPGDLLSLRETGMRSVYTVSMEKLYYQLVRWQIEDDKREREKQKMLRKNGLA